MCYRLIACEGSPNSEIEMANLKISVELLGIMNMAKATVSSLGEGSLDGTVTEICCEDVDSSMDCKSADQSCLVDTGMKGQIGQ